MSFSPTTGGAQGGEIESVLRQMLEQYLLGIDISSAGDEARTINKVVNVPEVTGFGDIIDNAIRTAVLRYMEDEGLIGGSAGNSGGEAETPVGKGKAAQALGLSREVLAKLKDPTSLVSEALPFLPHAAVASFVASSVVPILIHEMFKPGGPFDLRFKRIMSEEFNALQDRQTSYDIRIGQKGLIFQSGKGFLNHNQTGVTNTNTLRMLRDGGIDKSFMGEIDYVDHSRGLF